MIRAFQMHFYPRNISGELDNGTRLAILLLVTSRYQYIDIVTHEKDRAFNTALEIFCATHPGFSEYQ
jgi:hypothetical protein